MDANLAGLVALGALILGLFTWLRQDIRGLRGEMRSEIGGLRDEMRSEIGGLRGEMRNEIGGLRDEMRNEIGGLRDEMRNEIGGLRGEMNELRDRVARIEGLLEAVFMRRDLTPLPDPPLPGGPSPTSEAA